MGHKSKVDPVVDRSWSNDDIAEYAEAGFLTPQAVSRVILSLFHEMDPGGTDLNSLIFTVSKTVKSRNVKKNSAVILEEKTSSSGHSSEHELKPVQFTTTKIPTSSDHRVSPAHYEKYRFWESLADLPQIGWLAANVECVMLQMIDILSTDPVVLNLAKKFHMQKLIEERLNSRQHDRMLGTLADGHSEIIGQAFEHEHRLADITNRALFHLIKEKVAFAIEQCILPIPDVSDFDPATMPTVDAAAIHGVTPGFISNEAIQKILQADYVRIG